MVTLLPGGIWVYNGCHMERMSLNGIKDVTRLKRLMLIDGNSLAYRAFYALPTTMTSPEGVCTNAVHGFLNMMLKALEDYRPDGMMVAFDMHGPTFRHEAYGDYKGTRKPTPEELRPQFPMLKEILTALGLCIMEKEGYEADDLLGTVSAWGEQQGIDCLVVTGDRDSLQLVSAKTHVLLTLKGLSQIEEYTVEHLAEKLSLRPDQIPDLKGLMGDSSDNIPGIPGVGEKTALTLLARYETVDNLLAHTAELKGKLKEKVEKGADMARFSRSLATIDRQVPVEIEASRLNIPDYTRMAEGIEKLKKYALYSVAKRLEDHLPQPEQAQPVVVHPVESLEELSGLAAKWAVEEIPVALMVGESLSLARSEAELWQVPLMVNLLEAGWPLEEVLSAIRPLLEGNVPKIVASDDARKIGSGGRQWLSLAAGVGAALRGLAYDLTLMGYLLDATARRLDPTALYEHYVGRAPETLDAHHLVMLKNAMWPRLQQAGMEPLYQGMELPLVEILYRMEREGFKVDRSALTCLGADMQRRIDGITERIYALAGETFNINSTKQLGEVLFEKLGLPKAKKTKTGYSTDASVLEGLLDQHPIIEPILEYRQLTKLKGTYVDGLVPLLDGEDKLHTRLNQTLVATGRLSSAEPNLQNIPVRMEEGRRIRGVFVASGPGRVLVDADYSQIELRVLAHMAQDPRMIEAFRDKADIHTRTASQVFGVPVEQVTPQLRSAAKAVNFGIVYGISDFGLARQLDITRKEAGDYINRYLGTFDHVKAYMEQVVETGRERGYVETLYHRRRPMPELKAKDHNVRAAAERMAMNAPIQGTAADIIKLAMVAVDRALEEGGFKARLILQVHDELIVDAPVEEADAVEALLIRCMEGVASLDVPLTCEVHRGNSWMEAK